MKTYRYFVLVPVEMHLSSHRDGSIIVSVLMDVLISMGIVVMECVCFRILGAISYNVPNLTFLILPCWFCFMDPNPTHIPVPSNHPAPLTNSPLQTKNENKVCKKRNEKERKRKSDRGSCSDSGSPTVNPLVHMHLQVFGTMSRWYGPRPLVFATP